MKTVTDMSAMEFLDAVEKKSPEFENFLKEIAKSLGATEAIGFDGKVIKLDD